MKTTFTELLDENKLIAERTFEAPLEKVWKAWSDPKILCQWWAPLPYVCEIKEMDFREGGHWIYCMKGPEGDEHWGRMDYLSMNQFKGFKAEDYFVDKDGNRNEQIPPMKMEARFEEVNGKTKVTSITIFASAEAMKQMAEMGMTEGWDMAMNQLEELL